MIRVILFDWGDTVMRLFPDRQGPMACWPEVMAVPGVEEALQSLQPCYHLALATNASESGAGLVRAALRRVGLEAYFASVFTARELGVRKPDPGFFHAVLREAACAPEEAVMVGDEYSGDVVGAKEVGLRAIWFNAHGAACPVVHPLHDGEVRSMAELPAAVAGLRLPDVVDCLDVLAEQQVAPATMEHCLAVAAVAFRLAWRLRDRGEVLDPLLAHRGGLLHDLDKAAALRQGRAHGELGAEVLRERGHPELARIAARHLMFAMLDPHQRPATWEEKLVFYADKVVEGDRVAGVEERLAALCRRYPENAEPIQRCLPLVLELEAEIADRLGVAPADLVGTLA